MPFVGVRVGVPGTLGGAGSPRVNWGSSNFSFWRTARANVLAGTGRARIFCAGDSTTAGVGAFTASPGLRSGGYPADLASNFAAASLPATSANVVGSANLSTAASYTTYNPALTFAGSNWAFAGATAGGAGFSNSVDSLAASYAATGVDTFELTYLINAGNGLLQYDVDGSGATQIATAGTAGLAKVTIPVALGNHTLNVLRVSGGAVIFVDIVAYNSAVKAVDILNAGWGGSTSTDWNNNTNGFRARPHIVFSAPNLLIIQLGINDYTPATIVSVPTYTANLNAIIGDNIASRSILLVTPVPSIASRQTIAIQAAYVQAMYAVAASNNLPLFDNWKVFGSEAQSSQYYIADGVHFNETGYAKEALSLSAALLAA